MTFLLLFGALVTACNVNPYASTNRSYKKQAKAYARSLREAPLATAAGQTYPQGDYWVGTTNFNMRKPNFVVIHHTAQNSTDQTLRTFTMPKTSVSAHYVIGRDGKVYHMLNDYLRAWHGGVGRWGNNTDLNSSSIGIELDNNGSEPFTETQINSLLGVLDMLKKKHGIPTANFIGHSDIAPERKVDPSPAFPWKTLANHGFGLWYDEDVLDSVLVLTAPAPAADSVALTDSTLSANAALLAADTTLQEPPLVFQSVPVHKPVPDSFNPIEALRIIGYDTRNPAAAIRAFKLHFIQKDINQPLSEAEKKILYNLYKKYL
ncbi:MAG: N-acetylmuramoyl-L-alanine amidase [Hymenobacteraceae bacterium]|nr:N-acetylmuramoyl-L-alanine amidase [Hymenobacteraceae bacterium]